VGNVNGDAYDHIIFAVPVIDNGDGTFDRRGEVYLVHGDERSRLGAQRDLSAAPPDVTFLGVDEGDKAGWAVDLGDVNRDGTDDVVIGAPGGDGPGNAIQDAGEVIVLTSLPPGPALVELRPENVGGRAYGGPGDQYGSAVHAANLNGDVNPATGRAHEDVVAAPKGTGANRQRRAVFGRASALGTLDLASAADWVGGYAVTAKHVPDLASGDVNGDGIPDLLVGSRNDSAAALTYGSLGALSEIPDVLIRQVDARDFSGFSVAVLDVNGDPYGDLLILAPGGDGADNQYVDNPYQPGEEGEVSVVWGGPARLPAQIDLATDAEHFTLYGSDGSGATGIATSFQGPWNSVWGAIGGMELDGLPGHELFFSDSVVLIYRVGPHPDEALRFDPGGGSLSWPQLGGAHSYSVYRGLMTSLVDLDGDVLPDAGCGECASTSDSDTHDTTFVDGANPPAGNGFFYLMSFVDDQGVEKGLGGTSADLARTVPTPCASSLPGAGAAPAASPVSARRRPVLAHPGSAQGQVLPARGDPPGPDPRGPCPSQVSARTR
jgi:hypothetical protein